MKETIVSVTVLAILATGCATSSKDIATAYVSPMQYQNFDCDQLSAEAARLTQRVQQLGGRLDEAASNDKAIMGVGLILFWPALFALGGTKTQEAEYSRLKGEADALQQAAIAKKCPGMMSPPQQQPTAVAPAGKQEFGGSSANSFPAGWGMSAQQACIQGTGPCPPGFKRQ